MTHPGATQGLLLPPEFRIGVATAAYQIEGAWNQDGRGPSIWDTYAHTPGRIDNGDTGDVAVDHYHRLEEDLELLAELGVDSYRFSISWSRVLPEGHGTVNAKGVDFYSRLIDGLLTRGIAPSVTMYHWDLPQALEDRGGWTNRESALHFADYAALLTRTFGDRVSSWITLNEPWCAAFLGHGSGVMAPGRTDPAAALTAMHHLNLAHGLGVVASRAELPRAAEVGVALNMQVPRGVGDTAEQAERFIDDTANQSFLGPMLRGAYPEGLIERTQDVTDWSFVHADDLGTTHQKIDFLGVNYYSTLRVRLWDGVSPRLAADGHRPGASPWVGAETVEFLPQEPPFTAMGWNIAPEALAATLRRLSAEFPELPLSVTENGTASDDRLEEDGTVHDPARIAYIRDHLSAVQECIQDGVDVRGYYLWTLMDNFEWSNGFTPKFGLLHVEHPALNRVKKTSFHWYRELAATKRIDLAAPTETADLTAGRSR